MNTLKAMVPVAMGILGDLYYRNGVNPPWSNDISEQQEHLRKACEEVKSTHLQVDMNQEGEEGEMITHVVVKSVYPQMYFTSTGTANSRREEIAAAGFKTVTSLQKIEHYQRPPSDQYNYIFDEDQRDPDAFISMVPGKTPIISLVSTPSLSILASRGEVDVPFVLQILGEVGRPRTFLERVFSKSLSLKEVVQELQMSEQAWRVEQIKTGHIGNEVERVDWSNLDPKQRMEIKRCSEVVANRLYLARVCIAIGLPPLRVEDITGESDPEETSMTVLKPFKEALGPGAKTSYEPYNWNAIEGTVYKRVGNRKYGQRTNEFHTRLYLKTLQTIAESKDEIDRQLAMRLRAHILYTRSNYPQYGRADWKVDV